jgi:hypothetical protein
VFVVIESGHARIDRVEQLVEGMFAGVPEWRVANILGKRPRLDQVRIEAKAGRDCSQPAGTLRCYALVADGDGHRIARGKVESCCEGAEEPETTESDHLKPAGRFEAPIPGWF